MRHVWGIVAPGLLVIIALGLIAGCSEGQDYQVFGRPAYPELSPGRIAMAIPTGERSSSVILVERTAPTAVKLGDAFSYNIVVTNISNVSLEEVSIIETPPQTFRLSSSSPKGSGTPARLSWLIGMLEPGESRSFTVSGTATQTGTMIGCVDVRFANPTVCLSVDVIQPVLQLTQTLPADVILCDAIPAQLVVTNTGTGTAENVVIEQQLPDGVISETGAQSIRFDAGSLAAGQSREFTTSLRADRPGQFLSSAVARSQSGITARADASVMVRKPILELVKTAPATRYIGNELTYQIRVRNVGDAPARDTIITDRLPSGVQFIAASGDGNFANSTVSWQLGTLDPGQAISLDVTTRANLIGEMVNVLSARAYCAATTAEVVTQVRGIPAILLEMVDTHDPVPIGGQETYVVTITNQGSASDSNIKLVCQLPEGFTFIATDGPTDATNVGREITFAALRHLAPGQRVVYRIMARAESLPGDKRFKVKITTDQITAPVQESEATRTYQGD